MKITCIIPARYSSSRFPGKPLAQIAGRPLVQHVVERCREVKPPVEVIVATDDERIASIARQFCRVEMTRVDHISGTDRIAEVAQRIDCDAVINVQGDEPLIAPGTIEKVAAYLSDFEMSTAASPLRSPADYDNPNVVKVVCDLRGRALYFSRRTIPYIRDCASEGIAGQMGSFPFLRHLGIYGYRKSTLLRLVRWPESSLERAEKLEQLRALENGIAIGVCQVARESIGVDHPEDIARVEAILKEAKDIGEPS